MVVRMDRTPRHANPMGTVRRGVLCDLADAAMGMAYASSLDEGETFTTLELKISFLKPVWTGRLVATGRLVKGGRTVGLTECDVVDDKDRLVARASSTCMTLRGEAAEGPSKRAPRDLARVLAAHSHRLLACRRGGRHALRGRARAEEEGGISQAAVAVAYPAVTASGRTEKEALGLLAGGDGEYCARRPRCRARTEPDPPLAPLSWGGFQTSAQEERQGQRGRHPGSSLRGTGRRCPRPRRRVVKRGQRLGEIEGLAVTVQARRVRSSPPRYASLDPPSGRAARPSGRESRGSTAA